MTRPEPLLAAAAAAAVLVAPGCTIIGGPGHDPASGAYAFIVDLDDDQHADGIIFGCVHNPDVPPACQWQGIRPLGWWPLRVQP